MYSASAISTDEPPASWLDASSADFTSARLIPYCVSFIGSITTWYSLTTPPTDATSATLGIVFNSYFKNQSCRERSSAKSCLPLRSTSAYSKIQPTPVASGPISALTPAGSFPCTWLRYSSTRERAQ
ncbi:hypothetical protein D3C73_1204600 [compost metagenome]